jgi:UDPglucose 6-dehydrogenase
MRISVIGAGYVGLVTGACLAKLANKVTLIDIDTHKIKSINSKASPLYEEGLDELLNQVNVEVSPDYTRTTDSEVLFICVGTPPDKDGPISLEQITEATKEISKVLKKKKDYCVVAVKSTVAPGTTEELVIPILEKSGKRTGKDFGVCVSPEFLREGKAVYDFMNPARIIIGEYDKRSGDTLLKLYRNFNAPVLRTNLRTAEMIKLASNAFLAAKISFINEIGNICKNLGIDVYEVAKGMGYDDRIGNKFLNAGIGFGGSCLPKDIQGLISKSRQIGYEPKILQEVLNLNDRQALKVIDLLKKHISLKGTTIGVLGLAFKPGTDDIRDSSALRVVQALLKEGAKVKAYDPMAVNNFKKLFPQIEYVARAEALNSDAILILTEWPEFNELDYSGKIVVDGRRVEKAREAKIYEGICW